MAASDHRLYPSAHVTDGVRLWRVCSVDGGQVDLQDAVTTWVTERTKFELLRMSWVKESPDELAYDLVFRLVFHPPQPNFGLRGGILA
jgi:hypothetical protein